MLLLEEIQFLSECPGVLMSNFVFLSLDTSIHFFFLLVYVSLMFVVLSGLMLSMLLLATVISISLSFFMESSSACTDMFSHSPMPASPILACS